jgi:uncharacterized LabA/DUF88 family protein
MRVCCYVDGFNLYHAIDALKDNRLKWLDLRSLAQSYCSEDDELLKVKYFSALNTWDAPKRKRHINYVNALENTGTEVFLSKFAKVRKYCNRSNQFCPMREEKQTDVSIAVEIMSDCYELNLDRIIIISADSDQVPVVKKIRTRFPALSVLMVAPPKRLSQARELSAACSHAAELTAGRILKHQLPPDIKDKAQKIVASRPFEYLDAV